jgi:hypothetical protein
MLKGTHGSSFDVLAASSPRVRFIEGPPALKNMGGRCVGRLRSRREAEHPGSVSSCLHTESLARPAPKEYQGSYKRDMAAYHTPW